MVGPLGFARIPLLGGRVGGGAGSVAGVALSVSLGFGFVLWGHGPLGGEGGLSRCPSSPSLPPARGFLGERAAELRERPRPPAGHGAAAPAIPHRGLLS